MRRALVVLLAAGAGTTAALAERRPMTAADAFALREVREIRISPDASTVVFSVIGTDLQANRTTTHVMRVAATGGMPIELEGVPEDAESLRWSPDSRRVAFFATSGGRPAPLAYEPASSPPPRGCDYESSGG